MSVIYERIVEGVYAIFIAMTVHERVQFIMSPKSADITTKLLLQRAKFLSIEEISKSHHQMMYDCVFYDIHFSIFSSASSVIFCFRYFFLART